MQPRDGQNYWQGETQDSEELAPTQPSSQSVAEMDPPLEPELEQPQEEVFEPVTWEASEYIHHERDGLWFVIFLSITAILLAISIFLIKNYFFTALIVVMAIALFIYARRPPRVVRYTLSGQGLHIGQQFHSFNEYRAFGIVEDGALYSVKLLPTARFGQEVTLYFAETEGERIVDILGAFLPMENLHLDLIDRLLRRLRL